MNPPFFYFEAIVSTPVFTGGCRAFFVGQGYQDLTASRLIDHRIEGEPITNACQMKLITRDELIGTMKASRDIEAHLGSLEKETSDQSFRLVGYLTSSTDD